MRIRSRIGSCEPPPVLAGAAPAALVSSVSVVVTTTVTGWPRCTPRSPDAIAVSKSELQCVVTALGGSAGVARVVVRQVTSWPHRGFDGLEICARLRIEQTGQPRHPVWPLRAEAQAASPGVILVAEQSVGIEVVGNSLTEFHHDAGVDLRRMLDQCALGGFDVGG